MARTPMSPREASLAIAQLMPNILRGIQLDFFVKRGVTQTQFLVLVAIRAYDRCSMSTLARSLHVSMPTVSGIVDRLVQAGYVRRLAEPHDRRRVLVTLTAHGQTFFQQFAAVVRRRWEEVLASLTPPELVAFHRVITKLTAHLQRLP